MPSKGIDLYYRRLSLNKPSPTILQGFPHPGTFGYYSLHNKFFRMSPQQALVLQGYPASWKLHKFLMQSSMLIANSVISDVVCKLISSS